MSEPLINGIHHASITCRSLERSLAFYVDVLGLQKVLEASWSDSNVADTIVGIEGSAAVGVLLKVGNAFLELWEYTSPESATNRGDVAANTPGYTHVSFDVSDIDTTYERLSSLGVEFLSPPQEMLGTKAAYALDPDGNIFELQQLLDANAHLRLRPT